LEGDQLWMEINFGGSFLFLFNWNSLQGVEPSSLFDNKPRDELVAYDELSKPVCMGSACISSCMGSACIGSACIGSSCIGSACMAASWTDSAGAAKGLVSTALGLGFTGGGAFFLGADKHLILEKTS
jgi:hypothetical protein